MFCSETRGDVTKNEQLFFANKKAEMFILKPMLFHVEALHESGAILFVS